MLPIDREPDAPIGLIAAVFISASRFDKRLESRSVEIATHDAHALAVAPVELAGLLIENDLLRGMGVSDRNNDLAVLAVEIGALDGPVVQVGNAHIGPVDMTSLDIDDDAVGKMTARHDRLAVGTVRVHHMNFPGVYLENEEARDRCLLAGAFDDVQGRCWAWVHLCAFFIRSEIDLVQVSTVTQQLCGLLNGIAVVGMVLLRFWSCIRNQSWLPLRKVCGGEDLEPDPGTRAEERGSSSPFENEDTKATA